MVTLCLTFWCLTLFWKWLYHFTFPIAICECSHFSIPSPTLANAHLYYSHPSGYEVVMLICISLVANHVLIGHFYIFFGKNAYSDPLPIFKIGLSFYSWVLRVLYTFWIKSLTKYDLQFISNSLHCLHFLDGVLWSTKFLNFHGIHYLIFPLCLCFWCCI